MESARGSIYSVNGPVVKVRGSDKFKMQEMVYVGPKRLIGEVIGIDADATIVQVYEDTVGLGVGAEVEGTGEPLCVTLAPGIISNIFDGIERPLKSLRDVFGSFIGSGRQIMPLDTEKKWSAAFKVSVGDELSGGDVICEVPETELVMHRVMLPPDMSGKISWVAPDGEYTIEDTIAKIITKDGEKEIKMAQRWPIKKERPAKKRLPLTRPLVTGQRIMDTMFMLAKGGTAAIPGGFGTGKTMNQHQIAKWCDADIIVYIGCGERGNEMTQVLEEFSALIDPKSNKPLLSRTMLIANTSNMPVAAREASIYTGITIAEYYRDMGYHVALMADSTSRWAEALREISGRLEEIPAEEGFPAYLASRLSAFYERAGYFETLGGSEGSVSIIGAVSPQGGDFSEPVTQNTKRFIRTFWALDKSLAYARHYPAINWLTSYSGYIGDLEDWYRENVSADFIKKRERILAVLGEESSLMEIVKLIGADVLPEGQKATLEVARVIRLGFLQQNAFHKEDTYVPLNKQNLMMDTILYFDDKMKELVADAIPVSLVAKTGIADEIIKMKYNIPNDAPEKFFTLRSKIESVFDGIIAENKA